MSKVRFNIPKFMTGTLPSDGGTIQKDIQIVGTDGTTVIVKASQNTVYNEAPNKHFIATIQDENKFAFQFIFPEKTLTNSNSTQFTTPSKSVYIFSRVDGLTNDGKIKKNVKGGTIEITPPKQDFATSTLDSALNTAKAVEMDVNTFVDNSVLLETELVDKLSKLKLIKDSPFFAILIILYKLAMDMLVVLIFWVLFVSITCWLKIPSELLYPTNVDAYPFVYYKPKKNDGDDAYYNFLKPADDLLCKPFTRDEIEKRREKQETFFTLLKNLDPERKAILEMIYPGLMAMDDSGVQKFASVIQDKCSKTDLCTMDYLTYFVCMLVFYNYLYCGTTMGMIHSGFAFLSNNVIGQLNSKITMVGFAALLYYMFLSVGAMNEQVRKKLKIQLKDETEPKAILTNQLINLVVSIISCCLWLIIPVCTILVIVTLLTSAYVLGKSCLFPINTTVLVLAFFTFFFSLSQYVYIIKKLAVTKMNPFDLVEKMYAKDFSIRTLFSFLGISVPILFGLGYGSYIGFNLFFSFFRLMKRPEVSELLRNTTASVVMVGLFLLLLHVRSTLGKTYSIMTFFIIILVGIYVIFKK
jgi:hypothetical protein